MNAPPTSPLAAAVALILAETVSPDEAVLITKKSKPTIERAIASGKLPSYLLNRRNRLIPRSELVRLLPSVQT